MVQDNLQAVLAAIRDICARLGRDPAGVTLVGVTKFADLPAVNEAIRAGLMHIAENKVQLAAAKFPRIDQAGQPVVKHLIGHLQSNKAKDAVALFDLIQSVDSLKLLEEIDKRAAAINKVQDILVQLDIAQEEQKFGLPLGELGNFLSRVGQLEHVALLGVMTMAPFTEDRERIRAVFHQCREIFEQIKRGPRASARVEMKYLSMGMSSDYEIALEEGANMIRVGSAIFKQ